MIVTPRACYSTDTEARGKEEVLSGETSMTSSQQQSIHSAPWKMWHALFVFSVFQRG